ncbi:MAG: hypothetical protein MJY64_03520 [archaeon]|nr:hypothetical protein [archaeon]
MVLTKDLRFMLGDSKRAITTMTVPFIISYLVVQINIFADISWCSGLGSDASSAISSIFPLYWIIAGMGTGINVGASTSISRRIGSGAKFKADSIATQTIVLAVLTGLVISPVLYFMTDPIIIWIGADSVDCLCRKYIDPVTMFGTVIVLNGSIIGILNSEGAINKSMTVLLTAAILNIILDPIFIYGLDMGLSGAGYATVISSAISTAVGLQWYLRNKMYINVSLSNFHFKVDEMEDILFVGTPRAVESTLINVLSLVQRIFIVSIAGTIGTVFYSVPWRYVAIAMVISQAIGSALIPVCSAALGGNNYTKAEIGYKYATKITVLYMTIFAIIVFMFAEVCVLPFSYSDTMIPYRSELAHALRIYALFFPFMGLLDVGSSILQSLRMAHISMILALIRGIILVGLLALPSYFIFQVTMGYIYWSLLAIEVFGGISVIGIAFIEIQSCKKRNMTSLQQSH